MLEALLGSLIKEQILIFILEREKGYLREIATTFNIAPTSLVKPLENLEAGGILISELVGKTRVYSFSKRYFFLNELKALLAKAFECYPDDIRDSLIKNRRRPRRKGKPI